MTTISQLSEHDVITGSDFDAGEISGMRSAAWILLVTFALNVLVWALQRGGFPPVASLVDLFLGVQLLRLKHNWRAWALVRAGLGAAFALFIVLSGLFASSAVGLGTSILGAGQLAYCGSLFLLLFGSPSMSRVYAGRALFGLAFVLTLVGAAVLALQRVPA